MVKPVLNSVGQLLPIFVQKYEHYLPTAFDESMSLLQKVNKVIKGLSDVYTITNDVVAQWNQVMEWVLGDGINATISTRLDAMIKDGTFSQIINQELLSSKPDIFISINEPSQKTTNTFWYKDMGDVPAIKPYVTTEIVFDEEV
jgi:hypothetical protein